MPHFKFLLFEDISPWGPGSLAEIDSIKASTEVPSSPVQLYVAILVQVLKIGSSCLCSRMMHQALGRFRPFELCVSSTFL